MISNFLTVLFVLRSVYTGTPAYTCLLVETAHARDGKVHWALHFLHRQPAPRAHLHTRRRHTRHFLHVCARHLSIHLPLSYVILLFLSLSFSTAVRSFTLFSLFLPLPLLFLSLTRFVPLLSLIFLSFTSSARHTQPVYVPTNRGPSLQFLSPFFSSLSLLFFFRFTNVLLFH